MVLYSIINIERSNHKTQCNEQVLCIHTRPCKYPHPPPFKWTNVASLKPAVKSHFLQIQHQCWQINVLHRNLHMMYEIFHPDNYMFTALGMGRYSRTKSTHTKIQIYATVPPPQNLPWKSKVGAYMIRHWRWIFPNINNGSFTSEKNLGGTGQRFCQNILEKLNLQVKESLQKKNDRLYLGPLQWLGLCHNMLTLAWTPRVLFPRLPSKGAVSQHANTGMDTKGTLLRNATATTSQPSLIPTFNLH